MPNTIRDARELTAKNGNSDLTDGEKNTIAAFVINNQRTNHSAKYLEVGIWGGGTIHYLKGLAKTTSFTGIDLFEDFVLSEENTHGSGTYTMQAVQSFLGNDIHLIKGQSSSELSKLTDRYDHIFIDGDHSYNGLMADFNAAKNLLTPNGQISFHNCSTYIWPDFYYVQKDGGPWRVIQELKVLPEWRLVAEVERVCVLSRA